MRYLAQCIFQLGATAIDNTFIDATKFSNHITTPVINGLSDHDAQLISIHDIKQKLQKDKSNMMRIINMPTIGDFQIKF
jgi:hypothetical protein